MVAVRAFIRRRDIPVRLADQAVVSGGNFLLTIFVARELGPVDFGVFALVWTGSTFALAAHWALVSAPLQNAMGSEAGARDAVFAGALVLALGIAAIAAAAAFSATVALVARPHVELLAVCAGAVLAGIVLQDFARRWLLASERPVAALASDLLKFGGGLALFVAGARSAGASLPVAFLTLLAGCLAGCGSLAPELRAMRGSAWRPELARFTRAGRALLPSVMLQAVGSAAPVYMLGLGGGAREAGGLRAATTLVSPIVSLTEALETFLPLRVRQIFMRANGAGRREVFAMAAPYAFMAAGFLAGVTWLAVPLVHLVFGGRFDAYAGTVAPLALAMACLFPMYVSHVVLRARETFKVILLTDVLATAVLVVLLATAARDARSAAWCVAAYQAVKLSMLAAALLISPAGRGEYRGGPGTDSSTRAGDER